MSEAAGVDPDVHLLSDVLESACVARGHVALDADVMPGRWYVVVDTFVQDGIELEGPFALDVAFTPEAGSEGCAAHLVCDAGSCVCAGAGEIECDGACTDTSSDADNCGACGNACPGGSACVDSACTDGPGGGGGAGGQFELLAQPASDDTGGCSCSAPPNRSQAPAALAALGIAVAFARRRGYPRRSISGVRTTWRR